MQSSVDARREDAMTRSGRVREPRGEERGVLVRFLLELGEFERLQLHEAFGNATIWDFCREHLALRDGSASRRIRSARLLQRFPFIAEYLIDLRVGMTTLSIVGDALTGSTESNAREILDRTIGLSTRQVEALVAASQPPEAEPATAVRQRDDGRCQWKKSNGDICGSTWQTEIDHIVPHARGGPTTVDAMRILCRSLTTNTRARPSAPNSCDERSGPGSAFEDRVRDR